MRKIATILSIFAASCAFAAFTETETDFNGVNGWTISGSGSASELGAQNTTALLLDKATVDFDSTDGLEIKVGSGANVNIISGRSAAGARRFVRIIFCEMSLQSGAFLR